MMQAAQRDTRLEDAAARLEALGNTTRLEVYRQLVRAGDDGLAVGALQRRLGIAASTLSHHLRGLIEVGLVSQERRGTTLQCRAVYPVMQDLISFLSDECCADAAPAVCASPKNCA
jgi:DNA-binding transcriptional ArsR family regulator